MAHLAVLDGAGNAVYIKATGAGTAGDPYVLERMDSNGAAQLTALQTLASAVDTEVQVDVVGALPAGDNVIGLVGASDTVITIMPTLAAEAHSAGDLLFDSTEIANAVRANGATAIVQSITVVDIGGQKPEIDLIFANAATDFGTLGATPDPDDTEAATVIGVVNVPSGDYVDLGGASVATVSNVGLLLKAGAATTSIYLAGIAVGTPTPASTSDLVISIGLLRS